MHAWRDFNACIALVDLEGTQEKGCCDDDYVFRGYGV
jgi:hypothetical protein